VGGGHGKQGRQPGNNGSAHESSWKVSPFYPADRDEIRAKARPVRS